MLYVLIRIASIHEGIFNYIRYIATEGLQTTNQSIMQSHEKVYDILCKSFNYEIQISNRYGSLHVISLPDVRVCIL